MNCSRCQKILDAGTRQCPYCGVNNPISLVATLTSLPPGDPLIGLVLDDKYKLLELLGRGGMGSVYRARRLRFEGSDVAIKVLHQHVIDPDTRRRFRREASAAAQLSRHRNIVIIHDFEGGNADQSLAYIVMEFLEGQALNEILETEGHLEPSRAVSLMGEVCEGVYFAHQQGVVHRDLKPHNIVVLPADSGRRGETVKIVDFGLAKLRTTQMSTPTDSITPAGTRMGTPLYMSPEACRGEQLDGRSDIYSLGATMYHMLSGRPPFLAENFLELQWKHVRETPAPLAENGPFLPALEAVIMQALEKDPDKRQQDARSFAEQLLVAWESRLPDRLVPVTSLREFTFEVARIEASGKVIERNTKKARCFREKIDDELLELVEIPGGRFVMGSPDLEVDRHDDEGPQREVTVKTFYLAKYEITQAQWRAIADSEKIKRDLIVHPARFRGDKKPVERVSWHDANEFCQRLSRKTGRLYRLPTEAEWEYSCRAGMATPFCLGENVCDDVVNHNGNFPYGKAPKTQSRSTTTAVGSLGVANSFGLFDMLGNVWEWCQDVYYSSYEGAPTDASARLGGDNLPRVTRGGSWRAPAVDCGSAARNSSDPNSREDDVGFRVACSAVQLVNPDVVDPLPIVPEPPIKPADPEPPPVINDTGFRRYFLELVSGCNQWISTLLDSGKPSRVFPLLILTHLLMALLTIDVFVPSIFQNPLEPALWGIALGTAQALLLQRYLPAPFWWIPLTMAGAIVSGLIYYFLDLPWELTWSYVWGNAKSYPFVDRSTTIIVLVALRWFIIAMVQWLMLRKYVRAAILWPITTLLAAAICGVIINAFSRQMVRDQVFILYVVCAGLLLSLAQGVCLIRFRTKAGDVPSSVDTK